MRSAVAGIPEREEWRQVSGSTLAHHGPCCDRARAWLTAMGRSYDFSSTDGLAMAGPRWITQRWAWGPTRWPIAWCAEERISHWRRKWEAMPTAFNWIGSRVVYHEVNVVRRAPNEAHVYDPTEGFWLEPAAQSGHHGHLAIRAEIPEVLRWGPHVLVNGEWTQTAPRV